MKYLVDRKRVPYIYLYLVSILFVFLYCFTFFSSGSGLVSTVFVLHACRANELMTYQTQGIQRIISCSSLLDPKLSEVSMTAMSRWNGGGARWDRSPMWVHKIQEFLGAKKINLQYISSDYILNEPIFLSYKLTCFCIITKKTNFSI